MENIPLDKKRRELLSLTEEILLLLKKRAYLVQEIQHLKAHPIGMRGNSKNFGQFPSWDPLREHALFKYLIQNKMIEKGDLGQAQLLSLMMEIQGQNQGLQGKSAYPSFSKWAHLQLPVQHLEVDMAPEVLKLNPILAHHLGFPILEFPTLLDWAKEAVALGENK